MSAASPSRRPATRGFTLVELLVVVAIVAVLAALLSPAMKKALDRAKTQKCASNLGQIGQACLLYAADHDGQLPPSFVTDPASGSVNPFIYVMTPYIPLSSGTNAASVWFCPAARGPRDWSNTRPDYSPNERDAASAPLGIIARQAYGINLPNVRLASLPVPGHLILFADTFQNGDPRAGTSGYRLRSLGTETYFGQALPSTGLAPRHGYVAKPAGGTFNMVFADGHVEGFSWNDPRFQDAGFRTGMVNP